MGRRVSGQPGPGAAVISGLLILNDADTGLPLCVMDCTWVTAKRTGVRIYQRALALGVGVNLPL